jgi:YHS domain-containing protein
VLFGIKNNFERVPNGLIFKASQGFDWPVMHNKPKLEPCNERNTVMHRRNFLALILAASFTPAWAGMSSIDTGKIEGVALGGYDATSYFSGTPAEGDAAITHDWQGVSWRFASTANRDLFAANPEKYAPQYGGHCAYAAAKGSLAPGDPLAWTVHKDKLYINLSTGIRDTWSKDIEGYVAKGDANWPGLMAK